ncbi:beta-ketoacyl synthase N-terminal-like domain-containing protein [Paenibacillus filicis]|uniref:Beta-ketoacyl synthase N-terminal-like domain-containing protein n=1 Tax=Paenibacillus filicis TaxID=669464 RepID=A0ABU9DGC0_9BACL
MSDKLVHAILRQIGAGQLDKKSGAELLHLLKSEGHALPRKDSFAIIGMDVRLPDADDPEQFWENLRQGKDSIGPFPESRWQDVDGLKQFTYMKDLDTSYSQAGYLKRIDAFDHRFFGISPKEASLMDPNQRLFLEVAWHTLEDAGYGGKALAGSRTGLYIGYSGWPMYGQFVSYTEPESLDMSVAGNISAIIASRIPYYLDLKGPSMLVDTACSSSLVALHLACKAMQAGECDQALVGGLRLTLMPLDGYVKYGIEASDARAKAFDDRADGTALSEGVTAILIKPLDKALEDGDSIYAVIKGSAINQDGNSINITAPNAQAQEDVIVRSWKDAGIDPATISYWEAHGTGTKLGDPIEIDGIQRAFRRYTKKKQFCAIGSLKSNIGHTDAAAGLASVVKAALALQHQELPPTLHVQFPNRQISFEQSPVYLNDRLAPWESENSPRRCGVSSFGFSGTNCHVVMEEAPGRAASSKPVAEREHRLFALSAKSETAMEQLIARYVGHLEKRPDLDLADVCYTAGTGRGHYAYRLAVVTESTTDLLTVLRRMKPQPSSASPDDGVYYGFHKVKVAAAGRAPKSEAELTESRIRELTRQSGSVLDDLYSGKEEQVPERLRELAHLYVQGADIRWERLYLGQARRKVRLPVYPFDPIRCWLKVPELPARQAAPAAETEQPKVPFAESRYARQVFGEPVARLGLSGWEEVAVSVEPRTRQQVAFQADVNLTKALKKVAESCRTSPAILLLAAYQILLSKYSGQPDVSVGIQLPAVGRHLSLEPSGCLSAVRNKAEGYKTFAFFAEEVEAVVQEAGIYANESRPAAEGLKLEAGFAFRSSEAAGWGLTAVQYTLHSMNKGDELHFELAYTAQSLTEEVAKRFAGDYLHLLSLLAEDGNILIRDLSLPVAGSVSGDLPATPSFSIDFMEF